MPHFYSYFLVYDVLLFCVLLAISITTSLSNARLKYITGLDFNSRGLMVIKYTIYMLKTIQMSWTGKTRLTWNKSKERGCFSTREYRRGALLLLQSWGEEPLSEWQTQVQQRVMNEQPILSYLDHNKSTSWAHHSSVCQQTQCMQVPVTAACTHKLQEGWHEDIYCRSVELQCELFFAMYTAHVTRLQHSSQGKLMEPASQIQAKGWCGERSHHSLDNIND